MGAGQDGCHREGVGPGADEGKDGDDERRQSPPLAEAVGRDDDDVPGDANLRHRRLLEAGADPGGHEGTGLGIPT